MCTICFATQTFDPLRHGDDAGPEALLFVEGADAAENIFTAYGIGVGDTFQGTIADSQDEDWIAITLTAGETYQITQIGLSLSDPLLRLRDGNGDILAINDDSNRSLNSEIIFTASTSGTYYIEADAFSTRTGTYEVAVNVATPPEPVSEGTLDELALYLTEGYWGGREFTFNTNTITVNLSGLTAEGQQLARWAMEAWEAVVNLDFVEVGFGEMITFDDENAGAYAYSPGGSGPDGVELNISTNWLAVSGTSIDSYSFQTYVHEIGHAIGLGHQGGYNGGATYGIDNTFLNDSWQVSVMSYFDQTDNTFIDAAFGYTAGPMMADILAIQNLYGAPGASTATAGDTTYGTGSNLGTYMDEVFTWLSTGNTTANVTGNAMVFTLYDLDGIDTLNLDFLTDDSNIDLRAERFSDFGDNLGVMGIARGTVIENAEAGSGNDTIIGNGADNDLSGNAGNDTLSGANGDDSVYGGTGFDRLNGGNGDDFLSGGGQADNLFAGAGDDTLDGGSGLDRLFANGGDDVLIGGDGNDGLFGNAGNDTMDGGAGNDRFFGGQNRDLMAGGEGNDTLNGGAGFDTLVGGAGDDVMFGRFNADTFVFEDGHGNDIIGDFAARNNFERIDLSAVSAIGGLGDLQLGNANGGAATQVGANVLIDTGNGDSITLRGVSLSDLDANDFVF